MIRERLMRLSRLISDGMVIHKDKPFKIWGRALPGLRIEACLYKGLECVAKGQSVCSEEADSPFGAVRESVPGGRFELFITPPPAGEGYELKVTGYKDNDLIDEVTVKDVAVGLVYIMCGQSNAGFPMCRVKDTYPEEWDNPNNDYLRTFKIEEHYEFKAPISDVLTGEWKAVTSETIDPWCAVGYFAAKSIWQKTGLHVGIIDATQGGSPIESWMDRQWLKDYPDRLVVADKYRDDEFVAEVENKNNTEGIKWREALSSVDKGVKGHWEQTDADGGEDRLTEAGWKPVKLPAFLWETEIGHTTGSIWFKKKFEVKYSELINVDSHLWLGTMTDADITYVNGREVGRTEYSYPPRRYVIPAGTLHEGINEVTVRLSIERGMGRITPHKLLAIISGDTVRYIDDNDDEHVRWRDEAATGAAELSSHPFIDLSGTWYYRVGATCEKIPPYEFLCWKPTALYNGVLAPCLNYPIGAFMWYQGESNTDESRKQYYDLTMAQARGIREACGDKKLPYVYARLPRFDLNCYEGSYEEPPAGMTEAEYYDMRRLGWSDMQDVQMKLASEPYMYMADSTGLGEGYDLHPQDKKPLGEAYTDILLKLI